MKTRRPERAYPPDILKVLAKIEKNVPVPTGSGGKGPRSVIGKLMSELQKGDSFVTDKNINTVHSHARYYKIQVAYRSLGNGTCRVWRLK